MAIHAFKDSGDGYYQVDVKDGEPFPAWTAGLTPCEVQATDQQAAVPSSIAALQGMKAIDAAGMASAYDAWANDPARTFLERAFIDKAETWERTDPVLLSGAAVLGLTDTQIDDLFALASTL